MTPQALQFGLLKAPQSIQICVEGEEGGKKGEREGGRGKGDRNERGERRGSKDAVGRERGGEWRRPNLILGDVLHPGRVGLDVVEEVHLHIVHGGPVVLREGGREGGRGRQTWVGRG
jgi:hypothetical protein